MLLLASLKSKLRSLRSSKKEKRMSTTPVQSSSDVQPEKVATAAPVLTVSLPPPINVQPEARYERKMGDTELSYYLPSRANGVNDMCVFSIFFSHFLQLNLPVQVSPSRFQGPRSPHGS